MESKDSAFIKISESIIKDKKIGKHVLYKILGCDSKGEFEVMRRYKEFFIIHNLLKNSWPGCYVPSIPPKQISGNLYNNFIENRMKLLNEFLYKVMQIPYLYESSEFQSFIRVQIDFSKSAQDFKEKSYVEIAEKFTEVFGEYLIVHSTEDNEQMIQSSLKAFSVALPKLESFEQTCKVALDNFHNFEVDMNSLIGGLNEITAFYSEAYGLACAEISQRPGFTNPYSVLLDWVKVQILELHAMIEVLTRRNVLEKVKQKLAEKLHNEIELLEKLRQGKKKLMSFLSGKSKVEKLAQQEKVINENEVEMKAVDTICRINNERITRTELVTFKKENSFRLQLILSTFINSSSLEFDQIISEFKPLYSIHSEIFQ